MTDCCSGRSAHVLTMGQYEFKKLIYQSPFTKRPAGRYFVIFPSIKVLFPLKYHASRAPAESRNRHLFREVSEKESYVK